VDWQLVYVWPSAGSILLLLLLLAVWDELEKSNAEFFATYSKNRQEALENARYRHTDSAAATSASASADSSATTAASSSSNNLIMEFPQENAKGS
jgi:type II secretory pathway component GspD/PulD (secretin)